MELSCSEQISRSLSLSSIRASMATCSTAAAAAQAAAVAADVSQEQLLKIDIAPPELTPDQNPTFLKIGSDAYSEYVGALVGNLALLAGFALLLFFVTLGYAGWCKTTFDQAQLRTHNPGWIVVPLSILGPASSNAMILSESRIPEA